MSTENSDASLGPDNAQIWGPIVSVGVTALANLLCYAANEHSWIYKHILTRCGLPRLLFISNTADHLNRHGPTTKYWAFDLLDPRHLVQSFCLNTPMLLLLHAFTFLYFVISVLVNLVIDYYRVWCNHPGCNKSYGAYPEWLSFLTNWTITLLGFAGLVAFINTARHFQRERKARKLQQQLNAPQQGNLAIIPAHHPAAEKYNNKHQQQVQLADSRVYQQDQQYQQPQYGYPPQPAVGYQGSAPVNPMQLAPAGPNATPTAAFDGSSKPSPAATAGAAASTHDSVVVVRSTHDSGSSPVAVYEIDRWDWLSCAHCIIMEVATTAAFFVSFWYWVGIVAIANTGQFSLEASTFLVHAGNSGVALLQVILTRLPMVSYHFQVVLWYAALYAIFLWIFGETSGTWRYSLDWQQAKPVGVFILLPAVTFIMFAIWYLAARFREKLVCTHRRRHHRSYVEGQQHAQQQHGAFIVG